MPDINDKAAQTYIWLDMNKERADKAKLLEQVVPQWLKNGKAPEAKKEVKVLSSK